MGIIRNIIKDESGQALSEYGLILGLVVVGVIASLTLIGGKIQEHFEAMAKALGVK